MLTTDVNEMGAYGCLFPLMSEEPLRCLYHASSVPLRDVILVSSEDAEDFNSLALFTSFLNAGLKGIQTLEAWG